MAAAVAMAETKETAGTVVAKAEAKEGAGTVDWVGGLATAAEGVELVEASAAEDATVDVGAHEEVVAAARLAAKAGVEAAPEVAMAAMLVVRWVERATPAMAEAMAVVGVLWVAEVAKSEEAVKAVVAEAQRYS